MLHTNPAQSRKGHPRPQSERRRNRTLRRRFDSAWHLMEQPESEDLAPDTVIYHRLQALHRLHPDASADELEAVLVAVVKAREARSPVADDRHGHHDNPSLPSQGKR